MIKQLFIKYIVTIICFGIILFCHAQSEENSADKESRKEEMIIDLMEYYESNKFEEDFSLRFYERIDELVSTFPGDPLVGEAFSDVIMDPFFNYDQVMNTFEKIDTTSINADDLKNIKTSIRKMQLFQDGTFFYDFKAEDPLGQEKRTKDFRGNVLLVEFWTSGCGPCRQEHPEFNAVYNKFHSKGFEVFAVSLDGRRSSWIDAIYKDELRWINTIIPDGLDSEIAQKLLIQYVPSNFLIDREGKLIAYNISPHKLNATLEQILDD